MIKEAETDEKPKKKYTHRCSQVDILCNIIGCLNNRPMTVKELSKEIFDNDTDASSVGRIALRLDVLFERGMVGVLVVKNQLFFKLKEKKDG